MRTNLAAYSIQVEGEDTTYAMGVEDIKLESINVAIRDNKLIKTGDAAAKNNLGAKHSKISYKFPVVVPEVAGDQPPGFALFLGCGFAEEKNGSKVSYKPASSELDSVKHSYHMDGNAYIQAGSRGNLQLEISKDEYPMISGNFTSLYTRPFGEALPTDYNIDAFSGESLPVTHSNTSITLQVVESATLVEVELHSFSIDMGSKIVFRNNIGTPSVEYTGRSATGKMVIDAPDIDVINWYEIHELEKMISISLEHGTGPYLYVDAPMVQIMKVADGDDDGIATLELDLLFTESTTGADDEIEISFKDKT